MFQSINIFDRDFFYTVYADFFIKNKDCVVELLDTFDKLFGIKMNMIWVFVA